MDKANILGVKSYQEIGSFVEANRGKYPMMKCFQLFSDVYSVHGIKDSVPLLGMNFKTLDVVDSNCNLNVLAGNTNIETLITGVLNKCYRQKRSYPEEILFDTTNKQKVYVRTK